MSQDLVSVVITTYGRDVKLLSQAIQSVREQTYKEIELILVDDNGEGTEIQKKNQKMFSKSGDVCYVPNKKNSGAQFSRNIGILKSSGEYVAFLDDDDLWMPDKIEKQMEFLKDNHLDMVFTNGFRFYNNDLEQKTIYQQRFISNRLIAYETELKADRIGSTSHPLIRKECFAKAGMFDLDMPARQDYEMWLRLCKDYRVQGINEPLFYYRYHEGDRITKSHAKELRSYQLLWMKYKADYKRDCRARANILFTIALTQWKMKRMVSAVFWGLRSIASSPKTIMNLISNYRKKRPQF